MNETYHSTHGAITESEYVFLDKGLGYYGDTYPENQKIRILEIGFGTGLNAWLTALAIEKSNFTEVDFTTLEKYPLTTEITDSLNYPDFKKEAGSREIFSQVHLSGWESVEKISSKFSLTKKKIDVFDFIDEPNAYHVIYFDAFAPSKQPEMWGLPILQKMNQLLVRGGILVTYCAQGQFKRDLRAAGFEVEALPGPPGKKEMTRGVKV